MPHHSNNYLAKVSRRGEETTDILTILNRVYIIQGPHQVGKSGKSREFCDRSGSRENVGKNETPLIKNVNVSRKSLIVVPWSRP